VLFVLAAVLFAIWLIIVALKVAAGLIHLLLVAAVVLFVIGFILSPIRGTAA
jgi:hypothetical protein